jgi:hypothetical protein
LSRSEGLKIIKFIFVFKILNQFPNAFEFNEFYLEFLAYHYVSNRFKTFLLDSEYERMQFGITPDATTQQKLNSTYNTYQPATSLNNNQTCQNNNTTKPKNKPPITCIWEYINEVHKNSPKFFNFYYTKGQDTMLRPSCSIENLKLWRYYTRESLCTGPIYDLDPFLNSNDDVSYPVPLKNAIDYYEDLDLIHPSQFEIIIRELQHGLKNVKNESSQKMLNSMMKSTNREELSWKDIWNFFTEQVCNQNYSLTVFAYIFFSSYLR